MKRSGTASLPLHGGQIPQWLATRMAALGAAIAEVVILDQGRRGFLQRLSDPFWFQSFGAVLGMDWHSSGITTAVMGALKRGLASRAHELGLHVCGGRGRHSRRTPQELLAVGEASGLDGEALGRTSRLVAKVDNTAVQDGYSLYLHAFVVSERGDWVVVQQGMSDALGVARRYHWRSDAVQSFVEEPHAAVVGAPGGAIVNFTDRRARGARAAAVELSHQPGERVSGELRQALACRHLHMPAHHEVRATDVFVRRLHAVLAAAQERGVEDFEQLLLTPGLGPRTLQALGLVAEVAFGAPSRFDDPARFSFAHGGKDGHPHPVPLRVYDRSIASLRSAVQRARIGHSDRVAALQRLDQRIRQLERGARGPGLDQLIDQERRQSPRLGGMTAAGPAPAPAPRRRQPPSSPQRGQLSLFARLA